MNINNASPGVFDSDAALNILFSLPYNFTFNSYTLARDFNLHYGYWQPPYSGISMTHVVSLTHLLGTNCLSLISEVRICSHYRGNVLGLCFASYSLLAKGSTACAQ